MVGCSITGCLIRRGVKGATFHKFPSDPARRQRWLENCGKPHWEPPRSSNVCNTHFDEDQFELHRADGWKKLKPNAVPTIFPTPKPHDRKSKRTRQKDASNTSKKSLLSKYTSAKQTDLVIVESTPPRQSLRVKLKKQNRRMVTTPTKRSTTDLDDGNGLGNDGAVLDYNDSEWKPSSDEVAEPSTVVSSRTLPKINETSADLAYSRVTDSSNTIELVEVCFNNEQQHGCKTTKCLDCARLKRTVVNLIDERDALQKKIYCMNSAIRMLLDKEKRETLRSLANTISENWMKSGDE